MTSHLRPLKSGDPLTDGPHSAAAWSELVDHARYVERLRKHGPNDTPRPLFADRTMVRIKNSSGATRDRFDILGIDDSLLDPSTSLGAFQNQRLLEGDTPDADSHHGRFVILTQPLGANAIGWAWISGVCVVKIDFDYSDQPYADIKAGDAGLLQAGEGGAAQVLYKESGTGSKWAVVRIGVPYYPTIVGKLDADLYTGSSATLSVWAGNPLADTNRNITVYPWNLDSGNKLPSGMMVKASRVSGEWYVTPICATFGGTVGADAIAGDSVDVTISVDGSNVTISAILGGAPVPNGGPVLARLEDGQWFAAALGRTYRRFTLTATLDAGSSAAVEWEDETTGTVYDRETCCWGLIGETGEAVLAVNQSEDGVEWQVSKNPGQAVYEATTTAYISDSATTASVNITIGTATRTLTVDVPSDAISTDKQYPNSATVFVAHSRGDWKIVSFVECEEEAST